MISLKQLIDDAIEFGNAIAQPTAVRRKTMTIAKPVRYEANGVLSDANWRIIASALRKDDADELVAALNDKGETDTCWTPLKTPPNEAGVAYLISYIEHISEIPKVAIRKCYLDEDGWYFPFSDGVITAWRPLPEPYRPEPNTSEGEVK